MDKIDGNNARKKGFEGLQGVFIAEGDALKKLQSVLLSMLRDVTEVCEKHGLFYTLSGGSVLGAIRHKGFIPWDDDLDLNMPRRDFERFKDIFKKELGDEYELCTPEQTANHGLSMSQIWKRGTILRSYNELPKEKPGIAMDVFVMENVPNNPIRRRLHALRCSAQGYILTCRKTYQDYELLRPFLEQAPDMAAGFNKKMRIGKMFANKSLDSIAKKTQRVYSSCKDDSSKYITIPSGRKHYFGELQEREDMCESRWAEFEGLKVRIPKGTEKYMLALYGEDYMQLPPEEKREHHPLMELSFGDEG